MSRRKIKRPKIRVSKEAMQAIESLNGEGASQLSNAEQLLKLPQRVDALMNVNVSLVQENERLKYESERLNGEVSRTLEDHHNDIEALKKDVAELKSQRAAAGLPLRTQTFTGGEQ